MSPKDRARRGASGSRPRIEALEGRQLLSRGAEVTFQAPDYPVYSQQSNAIEVTLQRKHRAGTATAVVATTIDGVSAGSAVPGVQYRPIDQVVTFGRGQRTATVAIPVVAGAPNPGALTLGVFLKDGSAGSSWQSETLTLAEQADLSRPRVLGGAFVVRNGVIQGIRLAFDKPMAQGAVQDLANYSAKGVKASGFAGLFGGLGTSFATPSIGGAQATSVRGPIAFRSATFDPAGNTVTLVPYQSLKTSARIEVYGRYFGARGSTTPPTDLMGNPLSNFDITVSRYSAIKVHRGATATAHHGRDGG